MRIWRWPEPSGSSAARRELWPPMEGLIEQPWKSIRPAPSNLTYLLISASLSPLLRHAGTFILLTLRF